MWAIVVMLLVLSVVYGQDGGDGECVPCDSKCGDWTCITNCSQTSPPSNPTFDRPRCFVDSNGNEMADDCRELQVCLYQNNQYVCPVDASDPVCNGSCVASGVYGDIRHFDTNPADFDSTYHTYAKSRQAISWAQYQNTCGWQQPDINRRQEIWSLYGTSPVWVQGGILYQDAWFSFQGCGQYVDFSGRCWMAREANCSNWPYSWQRLENRCYPTSLYSYFYVNRYVCSLNWNYYNDLNTCQNNCQQWVCSLNYQQYSTYQQCQNSCRQDNWWCWRNNQWYGPYSTQSACQSQCSGGTCSSSPNYGSCWNNGYCSVQSEYLTTFYWNANQSWQQRSAYDWRSGRTYTITLQCNSWTNLDAYFGCGSSASRQTRQVCTSYTESVSPTGEIRYWYVDTNWQNCSSLSSGGGGSSQTSSNFYVSGSETFGMPVETRNVSFNNQGVLFVPNQVRCRPCATSLAGFPGQKELNIPDGNPPDNVDRLAQCANPRFFAGFDKRCRPGGITTLGASCCGISGWFKDMCRKGEKELKKRREAGTCSYVGDYCSRRVLGFCLERRRTFCCFNSKLARVFQECGRPQVGKGWGTGRRPDCSGFTIEEFSRVDFSDDRCIQMIEEWATEMASRLGDRVADQIAGKAVDRIQNWLGSVKNQKDYGGEK